MPCKKIAKAVIHGTVYHSSAYTQAARSASNQVVFYHKTPAPISSTERQYATISHFLLITVGEIKYLLADVQCHMALQPPADLLGLNLVDSKPSRRSYITATSILSRVIFVKNSNFKTVDGKKPMYACLDLDNQYDCDE
jgi:hypothetical protein